ncbi:hypothetical protein PIB30_041675 [Stylosanthes scabra]|uniref:Uncharacterized protein n=1 Tax=Stylosanthes scabra TaxID=79078 RepID=A0ABU6TES5_9FABA|nr:hypothetical protein [Stylosanthes scabra]
MTLITTQIDNFKKMLDPHRIQMLNIHLCHMDRTRTLHCVFLGIGILQVLGKSDNALRDHRREDKETTTRIVKI